MLVDDVSEAALARFREAFLAEIKRTRPQSDWGMIFMPAKKVEVAVGSVVFVYENRARLLLSRFDALKADLSTLATNLAGRPMAVSSRDEAGASAPASSALRVLLR